MPVRVLLINTANVYSLSEHRESEDGKSQICRGERSYEWVLSFVMHEARARNSDHQAGTSSVKIYYTTCETIYNRRLWSCFNSSPYLPKYIWLLYVVVFGFSNFLPDRYKYMVVLFQYMVSGATYSKPTPRYLTFQPYRQKSVPQEKFS